MNPNANPNLNPPDFAIRKLFEDRQGEVDENREEMPDGSYLSTLPMSPRDIVEAGLAHLTEHMEKVLDAKTEVEPMHRVEEGLPYITEVEDELNCIAGEATELARWVKAVESMYKSAKAGEN